MSWTQVFLTGLSKSVDRSDEEIEAMLNEKYNLSNDADVMWAGPGTTLIKRDEKGCCRGFAFLTFYSADGAATVIDRINSGRTVKEAEENEAKEGLPKYLQAELSNPKGAKERKKKCNGKGAGNDLPDLRVRRQRKAPIRKHPVIVSSNGKKTNLGNKNR